MKQKLEIIVTFNRNEIIGQTFPLTQTKPKSHDFIDSNNVKSDQIVVNSDFCQTIRFIEELNSCLNYRLMVFDRLKRKYLKKSGFNCYTSGHTISLNNHFNDRIVTKDQDIDDIDEISVNVKLKSVDHTLAIDKNWNKRILSLVVIRFRLEDSLSWLSTLGGAYSSLGEYNVNCALKAGQISISQLRLAAVTGDPTLIARCGIYMAFSLCQQQRRGEAIKMIRRTLYPFIIKIKNCDKIVISMFSSLCYRIKNFDNNLNKKSKH